MKKVRLPQLMYPNTPQKSVGWGLGALLFICKYKFYGQLLKEQVSIKWGLRAQNNEVSARKIW